MSWNIHPGEILLEEFMKPYGLNAKNLAEDLGIPIPRINDVVLKRRGITADTAWRLAHYFNTTPQFWMNLQTSYELRAKSLEFKGGLGHLTTVKQRCAQAISMPH